MIEAYAGPEALVAHMENVGHLLGSLFESGDNVDLRRGDPMRSPPLDARRRGKG